MTAHPFDNYYHCDRSTFLASTYRVIKILYDHKNDDKNIKIQKYVIQTDFVI